MWWEGYWICYIYTRVWGTDVMTGIVFCKENAKCWSILAPFGVLFSKENCEILGHFGQFWRFCRNLCTSWRNFYRLKKCSVVPKLTNIKHGDFQRSSTNTYILQIVYFCLEIRIPAGWNTEQDNLEKRANSVCQGIFNTFLHVVLYGVVPIILNWSNQCPQLFWIMS